MEKASTINRQWRLRRVLSSQEVPSVRHFSLVESERPNPSAGEILVRVIALGTSPAQRMYISAEREFHFVVAPGEVMRGRGVGEVIESNHPNFSPGDLIQAHLNWQDFALLRPDDHAGERHAVPIEKLSAPYSPLSSSLGLFGQLGCSAWVSLFEIGKVQPGDVVLVSAAAGGVGSIACQLAKIAGAKRVIGIAGGAAKCNWLLDQSLCDAVIDYQRDDLAEQMSEQCPDGANVYLDSVGGDILDLALSHLAIGARVVLCGMISTEYQRPRPPGPTNYYQLLYRRARMEGFFVFDYHERWPDFINQMVQWYSQGKLRLTEHVFDGLERAPDALESLFTGHNTGGAIIRVSEDPEGCATLLETTSDTSAGSSPETSR